MRASVALVAAMLLAWPATREAQQPVFRAGVDYVRVDVVVTGSDDKPITDLARDDFELVERGRVQTISDFEFVSVPVLPRSSGPVAAPGPSPDVVTNTASSRESRLFVLVVDDLHILESDLIDTKRVMTEFIRALAPDDEVAIVFVGHSNLSQNFTRDRSRLLKAVDRTREALGFGLDALGKSNTSTVVRGNPRVMNQYARRADDVLRNVALSVAGSTHSRRAIVYVTAGSVCPTTPASQNSPCPTDFDELQDAYETARRANVPIYTIDPRGPVLPNDAVRGGIGAIDMTETSEGAPPRSGNYTLIAANIRLQQNRLAEIAINTGGRHFTNQTDLTRAVRAIVADNGSYYVLGYYPNPFDADGRFHTFVVNVRRPGARVRARQGYVASGAAAATSDVKPLLDAAMVAGVNVSALGLRAFVAPIVPTSEGMMAAVTVEVTYPARPAASRPTNDELRLSVLALDPDARVRATSERVLAFQSTASETGPKMIVIHDVIELPSQPLTLRIGVAATAIGKAGTVQMPVNVPKPFDGRLHLSGIPISTEGFSPAALNAVALGAIVPFQPAVTRVFASADTLRVYGRVFWRGSGRTAVSVGVKGTPATLQQPMLAISPGPNGGQSGEFDVRMPLAGLAPGQHTLEVTARLKSGKPVTHEVPFEIR